MEIKPERRKETGYDYFLSFNDKEDGHLSYTPIQFKSSVRYVPRPRPIRPSFLMLLLATVLVLGCFAGIIALVEKLR